MANFAVLESRSLVAALKHASNAVLVQLSTGTETPVIFDDEYQTALDGAVFEASQPSCAGATAQLQGLTHQGLVGLRKPGSEALVLYAVVSVQPDGTGMTRLLLELAT